MKVHRFFAGCCAFSVLVLALVYSACSPEVTIVGDKEKPIPINAEIKIHIYQHASSVVDDLQEGLEEEYEEDEIDSSGIIGTMFLHIARNIGVPAAHAATPESTTDWTKAKNDLKAVYRSAYSYLKKGFLGENRDGYVSVIDKAQSATDEQKKKAAEMADKLNKARKAFYELDAKQQGVDIRIIQENYARAYRDKANGIWVEERTGNTWKWVKK